jgi:general stress protein 26
VKRTFLAVAAALVTGALSAGAQPAPPAPGRAQVLGAAREVMKQARYATLITIDAGGQPQARVMDPADPDADLTVWIATNPSSRKVGQLRRSSRATLLYFDRATESYVTLVGAATLQNDPAEKERHWQAKWAPHYPDGPRANSHMLIRFTPRTLEIVSAPHKLQGDPKTWRPVVIDLPPKGGSYAGR